LAYQDGTLIVRADANSKIGAGHVLRCMQLALAWRERGGSVLFCGNIDSETIKQGLISHGFQVIEPGEGLDATTKLFRERELNALWIVLDGYHFGPEWQDALSSAGYSVLVVDDGARMPRYSAKVILAPDPFASPASYLTNSDTVILAGPRYRLLRKSHSSYSRTRGCLSTGSVILVTFGGADTGNLTGSVLHALQGVLGKEDSLMVVLGPLNQYRISIERTLSDTAYRYEILGDVREMAPLYAQADFAISSAGGTAWEMAAVGLPALLIPVAKNQEPSAEYLESRGAAINLRSPSAVHDGALASKVRELMESTERKMAMSAAGPSTCDGKGPDRVIEIMDLLSGRLAEVKASLRRASAEDVEEIFRLANDPVVRSSSFSPEPISLEDHVAWYSNRLISENTVIYVLEVAGMVAASIRFDRNGSEAEIDVVVHPAFRGKGFGRWILTESVSLAAETLSVGKVVATVFENNIASLGCFSKAGFSETQRIFAKGRSCVVFEFKIQPRKVH